MSQVLNAIQFVINNFRKARTVVTEKNVYNLMEQTQKQQIYQSNAGLI